MSSNESAEINEPLTHEERSDQQTPLQEGLDYYLENGLMVFTAYFLTKRGYCCERGCRHCPYGFSEKVK